LAKNPVVSTWLSSPPDPDFQVRHSLGRALNLLCKEQTEIMIPLVKTNTTPLFIEWILSIMGCHHIQRMALDALIKQRCIVESNVKLFTDSFVKSIMTTMEKNLDIDVRRMSAEALYHFSRLRL